MFNPPTTQSHARQRAEWTPTPSSEHPLPSIPSEAQHQHDVQSPPPQTQTPDAEAHEQKRLRKKNRDRERERERDGGERHRNRDRDRDRDRERDRSPSVPSIDVQIRQIYAECEAAHGKARLLSENVALANPDDVEADAEGDVIQEFYAECVRSQEYVLSQISWATAEAEKSREREAIQQAGIESALSLPAIPNGLVAAQTNAFQAKRGTIVTKEEEMLGALLGANQALTDAIKLRDDWQRAAIAQREERYVEERSRVETRIDRSVSVSTPSSLVGAPRLIISFIHCLAVIANVHGS